jgi:hypothetical protein
MSGVIVVTGATGNVGSEVLAELLRAGRRVRAAVPGREVEAARERWGPAVEVVRFEFEEPDAWDAALRGADGIFLMRPPRIRSMRHRYERRSGHEDSRVSGSCPVRVLSYRWFSRIQWRPSDSAAPVTAEGGNRVRLCLPSAQ